MVKKLCNDTDRRLSVNAEGFLSGRRVKNSYGKLRLKLFLSPCEKLLVCFVYCLQLDQTVSCKTGSSGLFKTISRTLF